METTPLSRRSTPFFPTGFGPFSSPPGGFLVEHSPTHAFESQDLFNRLGAIVWEADPFDFRTIFVSRQAEDVLGYPLQAWHEDPSFFERRLHPQDGEETITRLRRAVGEGGDHVLDLRMLASDGSPVSLRVYLQSVCDWQGRPRSLHGVMIDVGSRRLEACIDGVGLLPENSSSEASVSSSSGRGRLPLLPRPEVPDRSSVDLNLLVRLLEPVLRSELGRAISLRLSLAADPAVVPIEPDSLERMLLCLARYANRSMLQGGELAIATSLEKSDDDGRALLLTCVDTGLGLAAVRRASVFAPLFSGGLSEPETGLLETVEEIVDEIGGSLLISDQPFGGTRFEIALPVS